MILIHTWKLDSIPKGLYVDESSIGLNAASVSETGYDEHGKYLPTYFEAFGEYKNPLYIYSTALIFKLAGISVFNLRLTSFIFFLLFLAGLFLLVKNLFRNNIVTLYSLLAGGTLPWFFNLSRMAFEVISQPAIIIFCLYFVYKTYCDNNKHIFLYPLITGLLIGLSVYSFTTARLLSFLLLLTIIMVYYKQIEGNITLLSGFFISIIPYLCFYLSDPSKLTNRFTMVTYIYDTRLTLIDKFSQFLNSYVSYLSPSYLFLKGDSSMRHHNAYGGELYIAVVVLSVIGLAWLFFRRKHNHFSLFLLINLLLSPVAAALTTGDSSLRSILVGLYLLIFSTYGINVLISLQSKKAKLVSLTCLATLFVFEVGGYLNDYFSVYPQKTVWAFESYDLPKSLQTALNQNPTDIIVSNQSNEPYAHLDFYKKSMHLQTNIPIIVDLPIAQPGRCIIYFASNQTIINGNTLGANQLGDPSNYSLLKCFYGPTISK